MQRQRRISVKRMESMSVQSIGICKCYTQYLPNTLLEVSKHPWERPQASSQRLWRVPVQRCRGSARDSEGMPWPRILETIASTVPTSGQQRYSFVASCTHPRTGYLLTTEGAPAEWHFAPRAAGQALFSAHRRANTRLRRWYDYPVRRHPLTPNLFGDAYVGHVPPLRTF